MTGTNSLVLVILTGRLLKIIFRLDFIGSRILCSFRIQDSIPWIPGSFFCIPDSVLLIQPRFHSFDLGSKDSTLCFFLDAISCIQYPSPTFFGFQVLLSGFLVSLPEFQITFPGIKGLQIQSTLYHNTARLTA